MQLDLRDAARPKRYSYTLRYSYSYTYKVSYVSDKRIRNIPEVVLVRRGAVGVLGIWEGGRVG